MVKMGQEPIRRVRFQPPRPGMGDVEVNTVKGIRDRGGPHEFLTPQRLNFDLLVRIAHGSAQHTVDFDDYTLSHGDVLWVRAGQVHQWGSIDDLEGTVAMFNAHTIDERTRDLIRTRMTRDRNHWPAEELEGTPVLDAVQLLSLSARAPGGSGDAELHQTALAHGLAALLAQLALVDATGAPSAHGPTHEVFLWFRDHIEDHYSGWHKVSDYADRLGYSTRTLNRLARRYTGLSAKELIDERVVLEAKRKLCHTDASVSEIAEQLGFDDASNFSSYFRRQADLTPGTFRLQSRSSRGRGRQP